VDRVIAVSTEPLLERFAHDDLDAVAARDDAIGLDARA